MPPLPVPQKKGKIKESFIICKIIILYLEGVILNSTDAAFAFLVVLLQFAGERGIITLQP